MMPRSYLADCLLRIFRSATVEMELDAICAKVKEEYPAVAARDVSKCLENLRRTDRVTALPMPGLGGRRKVYRAFIEGDMTWEDRQLWGDPDKRTHWKQGDFVRPGPNRWKEYELWQASTVLWEAWNPTPRATRSARTGGESS